ncbi:MAG: maltotransferase domain-containing protein [Thermoplasmataceae archaeon]|jgi:starch synthase (maltosyl-transferring)
MNRRSDIVIEEVMPAVDNGNFPAKASEGSILTVTARIYRSGSSRIRARVASKHSSDRKWEYAPLEPLGNDLWAGKISIRKKGNYSFKIQSWEDDFGTWREGILKWAAAGEDVKQDQIAGVQMLKTYLRNAKGNLRTKLSQIIRSIETATSSSLKDILTDSDNIETVYLCQSHHGLVSSRTFKVLSERKEASFSAWYELFPRSQGQPGSGPGTFADVERRIPDIKEMGFDVIYLTPIHPIGKTNRRGKDGSPRAKKTDPGSPWAIGSELGGHKDIDPSLGTVEDFLHLVEEARKNGLEIALDIAIQCSPDHPYVKEHPEWFYRRPDGSIRYAENPPKKYYDIYPLKFEGPHKKALYEEMKSIFLTWAERGVRIFRVDNPHTKPFEFWEWLIGEVRKIYPDCIFLAEAFTRPSVMYRLSKIGFSSSYTYFTWRNYDFEIKDYFTEISSDPLRAHFRPMLFPNTPDILPPVLQTGGRAAFKMRAILAATLSPLWGIYSGFELCENEAIEGKEEYLNSEKYEIKKRDWFAPGNIRKFISVLNRIRKESSALMEIGNLEFHTTNNPNIIFYTRKSIKTGETLMIAVNINPFETHQATVEVPLEKVGICNDLPYRVTDLLTGATYTWQGEKNYVRLIPDERPAHILRIGD